jgi:hypothetical protein
LYDGERTHYVRGELPSGTVSSNLIRSVFTGTSLEPLQ